MNMLDLLPVYDARHREGRAPSCDELDVIADWLLDQGRPGDAALVRTSWRNDTWCVYRDSYDASVVVIYFRDAKRFLASCYFVANRDRDVREYTSCDGDTFDVVLNSKTREIDIHFSQEGELAKKLDTELVVIAYTSTTLLLQRWHFGYLLQGH